MDKTRKNSLTAVIARIRKLRAWEDAHLPIYRSLLGRDLMLVIASLHLHKRELSLKEIYLDLPYSENAIRLHLRRLANEDWIALPRRTGDKRLRQIKLRPNLVTALEGYFQVLTREEATDGIKAHLPVKVARITKRIVAAAKTSKEASS